MRFFSVAIALAALFMVGFSANAAYANCHAKLEAAEEKLSAIPKDMPVRQQLMKMIAKAKKYKDHKKKKKKCKIILKKANKFFKKVKKQVTKEGIGGCAGLIDKAEYDLAIVIPHHPNYEGWKSDIVEAKNYMAKGKKRDCVQLMKMTTSQITNYLTR